MPNLILQDIVIVSFSLSKHKLVPAGIPEKQARTRESMDARHVSQAFEAGRLETVERGRLFDGQMTTGEQELRVEMVTIAKLEQALLAQRFVLSDIHWHEKLPSPSEKRDYKPKSKFIVNTTFTRLPTILTPVLPHIPEELTTPVWGLLCLWQNFMNTVVNLTARAPSGRPLYSAEVENNLFITRPL